jgi:predicted dienelactone hydrolase
MPDQPSASRSPAFLRPALPARRRWLLASAATGLCAMSPARGQTPPPPALPAPVDETWTDPSRGRAVPLRIRWPAAGTPEPPDGHPVVLFSHGLGGTVAGGEVWGRAWAAAGLVVLHLQHPGSDLPAVRRVARDFSDRSGLRQAIGPAQLLARLDDVRFILDELSRRRAAGTDRWAGIRPQAVGMSGHSFGAHTTLGMAGQRYPGHPGIDEPRLSAFIAFSPTLPALGDPIRAFERLTRPVLCITGTRDDDVVGVGATPERRIGVFDALPAGSKAQLVLEDADHMTFAGQTGAAAEIIARSTEARALQDRHHAQVAALTTDWWRAWLLDDAASRARLGTPVGLARGDRWQTG